MIKADQFRVYLERQEAVVSAICNAVASNGNIKDIQDVIGYWVDGRIMDKKSKNKYFAEKARRAKKAREEGMNGEE